MAGRGSVYGRAKPVFRLPVSDRLTDEERRRLAVIRDEYPHVEWLGRRGVDHCRFLRWFWRQDGETNG